MKHPGRGIKTLPPVAEATAMLFLPTSQDSSVTPCDFQNDIRGICHAEFVRDE